MKPIAAFRFRTVLSFFTTLLALVATPLAHAQFSESVTHTFCTGGGVCADGSTSLDGLIQAQDGNLYGVTGLGGTGSGSVYKVTAGGALTTLHSFNGSDGLLPAARLVQGADGNLYGLTDIGGTSSQGTVFKMTPSGTLTTLHSFTAGADGANPVVGLTLGSDGNLYGTTTTGGAHGDGTAFKITPTGTLTTLYAFCSAANCADGNTPYSGLLQGADGNFYGTTTLGGATNHGTIFQLTPAGALTTLYSFTGAADGERPNGSLTQDAKGNLYGVTSGAATSGTAAAINGTLWQFTFTSTQAGAASGTLTTLHAFAGAADGKDPYGGPVVASDGNVWGTTTAGGSANDGTIYIYLFSINSVVNINTFTGAANGNGAYGVLQQAADGTFYSTTVYGGSANDGVIYHFAYTPGLVSPLTVTAPATANVGTPFTLSMTATNAWSTSMQQCYAFQTLSGTTTALGQITVAKSASNVTGSLSITPTSAGTVTYSVTCGGIESSSATVTVAAPAGPPGSTVTTLVASPNPVQPNQMVTFTATVISPSGTPTGTVNLVYNNFTIYTGTLTNGQLSFTGNSNGLAPGSYSVVANYLGGGSYTASTSAPAVLVVQAAPPSGLVTTTTLAANNQIVPIGANYSFTAVVTATPPAGKTTAAVPTGTVSLNYNGNVLSTVTLDNTGTAMFSGGTNGVAAGTYALTATYNGDSNNQPSTSTAATIQVGASIPNSGTTAVTVTVNPLANRHTISPLIYGVNLPPSEAYLQDTGATFTRWAGQSLSNYNWQTNDTNTAENYYFMNTNLNTQPGTTDPMYSSSQNYVSSVVAAGATPLISLGALPWVAKDGTSYSYSVAKYGAQCSELSYLPDVGDGLETDCATPVTGSPDDAYVPIRDVPGSNDPAGTVYRNQWVQALAAKFGTGPHIYGVDNEIEFWNTDHQDTWGTTVTGYNDFRNVFLTEAPQIKQWDPNAIVIGPDNCCWYFYWNTLNNGDHAAHANQDFSPWWLNEVLWADTVSGKRSLDWFDLHVYMNPTTSGMSTAATNALYLRLMRDLWDPTYTEEQPDFNPYATSMQPNPLIALRIPRMRALVNYIYPGTQFDFTEWNRLDCNDTLFVTALMTAEEYAIFGMENLYASARWPAPAVTTSSYWALKLFRNYDGNHGTFAPISVQATNNGNVNLFSSYAGINAAGTQMTLMLVNKDPANQVQATLNLGGFQASSQSTYMLTQTYGGGILSSTGQTPGTVTIPPYTAMLVVLNGTFAGAPQTEWQLNPDVTMAPAGGAVFLAPKITSGTGTVTLSNAAIVYRNPTSGNPSTAILTAQVTPTSNGNVLIYVGTTPGFYQFQVTGTDNAGVTQTQQGWIFVQNPAATLTKTGDAQTATHGTNITLTATLVPGQSGAGLTGAGIFFTASAGTLSAREVTTNSSGQASVTLTLPPTPGAVTVTAEGPYGLGHPEVTFTETAQ
jgi:uncharacterized repeat protein (TIGR03803 family)